MPDAAHTVGPAVFLSYAREDATAVRRIAEALRVSGVEVWFDENELRGGDSWDAKIRRQIRECSLFVPVVSATTQARHEGYFRREWKLAVERAGDMAAGVPFLVPVVIDDTPEAEALVPDEFMRLQWTRLPGALPTPAFVAHVKHLLESPRKPGTKPVAKPVLKPEYERPPTLPAHLKEAARARQQGESARSGAPAKSLPRAALWISLAVVAVSVAVVFALALRRPEPAAASSPPPAAAAPAPAAQPARVADKSIAVLPFSNMSDDKDNAFFADGVHEDVLTNLALIRELRVVSRTSVQSYRATTKSMKQIADELGVTYILEGSVRRFGNKVRVTGQLIHAATDEHVWAATYDRDLTDIFAIQSELSRQIAAALRAALSPSEEARLVRKRTANPQAYDHFLRARDIYNREGNTISSRDRRIQHLRQAVLTDPDFAEGWSELAAAYAYRAFTFEAGMDEYLAEAEQAIARARALAPDDPEVRRNVGTFHYYAYRDYERALQEYRQLALEQPNDPTTMNSLALILRRQGKWTESLGYARRAAELDPANITFTRNLRATLIAARRWEEALVIQRRLSALLPDDVEERFLLELMPFLMSGSTREGDAYLASLDEATRNQPRWIRLRLNWAANKGDLPEALRLLQLQPYFDEDRDPRDEQDYFAARLLLQAGDRPGAIRRLGDTPRILRARLEQEPRNPRIMSFLAGMESIAGNAAEARRLIDRSCELISVERDALDGATYQAIRAYVLNEIGEKELALPEYRRLLQTPCTDPGLANVHLLRAGNVPTVSSLHDDPRFEALLKDPRNNAPLF